MLLRESVLSAVGVYKATMKFMIVGIEEDGEMAWQATCLIELGFINRIYLLFLVYLQLYDGI